MGSDRKVGAAAVIIDERGRVLLVKHRHGPLNWELPGGRGEPGESASDTAVREVREETGLRVTVELLTGVYYEPAIDMHHFAFTARKAAPADEARSASEETTDCGYFPVDMLPRPIPDVTVQRIHDALGEGASSEQQILALALVTIGPCRWFT